MLCKTICPALGFKQHGICLTFIFPVIFIQNSCTPSKKDPGPAPLPGYMVTARWFPQGGHAGADVPVPSSSCSWSRTGRSFTSSEPHPWSSLLWRWEGCKVRTACLGLGDRGCPALLRPWGFALRLVWEGKGPRHCVILVLNKIWDLVVILRGHSHLYIVKDGPTLI